MMDKIQCIKHKFGFLVVNLDTLLHKNISFRQMKLMISDSDLMADFVTQLDGEPYQKRLAPYCEDEFVSAHLLPAYDCNYRCSYCYQNKRKGIKKRMRPEYISNVSEFYARYNSVFKTNYILGRIDVTGGEPFLPANRSIIEEILFHWPEMPIGFITNGAYLNDYKNLLKKHKLVRLTISVDGIKEIHYRKRIPTDIAHYDAMMEGVIWALSEGIRVSISSLFNLEYLNYYPAFFDELEQLGWLKNPNIQVVFNLEAPGSGSDEYDLDVLEHTFAAFSVLRTMDSRAYSVDTHLLMPGYSNLMSALQTEETQKLFYPSRCESVVKPSYTFTPEGYVNICSCVETELGTVGRYWPEVEINVPRIEEIQKRRIDQLSSCKSCVKRVFCRGGCFATLISKSDNLLGTYCGIWENPTFLKYFDDFLS